MNLEEASVFSSGQFHYIVCWSECLTCVCLEFNKLLGCIDSKVLANLRWFWALLLQRSLLHLSLPALLGLQFCKCLCAWWCTTDFSWDNLEHSLNSIFHCLFTSTPGTLSDVLDYIYSFFSYFLIYILNLWIVRCITLAHWEYLRVDFTCCF